MTVYARPSQALPVPRILATSPKPWLRKSP